MVKGQNALAGLLAPMLLALALLAGCSSAPIKELTAYQGAFKQTAVIGDDLYRDGAQVLVELDEALKALPRSQASISSSNPPAEFVPAKSVPSAEGIEGVHPTIALRLLALETVVAYNDALVAEVSGDPLEKIVAPLQAAGTRLQGFAGLASKLSGDRIDLGKFANLSALTIRLNPFGGVALDGIKALARLGLEAKAAAEIRESLNTAYPDIKNVLLVLKEDTAALYRLQKHRCHLRQSAAIEESTLDVLLPTRAMTSAFARPSAGSELNAGVSRLEDRMTAAVTALFQPGVDFDPCGTGKTVNRRTSQIEFTVGAYPYVFPFGSTDKAVDANSIKAMEAFVSEYELRAARTVGASESLRTYHGQVLPDYVAWLRSTEVGLDTLHLTTAEQADADQRIG
jgi:hypothetical protein